MHKVLADLIGINGKVYLDEIIVFSDSSEDHVEVIKKIAQRLNYYTFKNTP